MPQQITITFDRENKTHNLVIDECNGEELLLAYQSLANSIEEKVGMPVEMAQMMAYAQQEKGKEDESTD